MAADSVIGAVRVSVVRRWLEVVLPLYTAGCVFVWLHQDYMPSVLAQSMNESPLPWLSWGLIGALTGILALWILIVAFFLVYSPFYLMGKLTAILGKGAWVDKREIRFYMSCFLLLASLVGLSIWDGWTGVMAFVGLSGCGPLFWRYLV